MDIPYYYYKRLIATYNECLSQPKNLVNIFLRKAKSLYRSYFGILPPLNYHNLLGRRLLLRSEGGITNDKPSFDEAWFYPAVSG